MIIYGFLAAVLPVWVLLTPRHHLAAFLKARTITLTQRLMPLFKAAAVVAIFLTLGNAAQESFQTNQTSPAGMAGYNKVEKGASVALGDSAVIDTLKKADTPAASLNIIK